MDFNPLEGASSELVEAVKVMGGQALLGAIDELVRDNEEHTVDWFDAKWDDLTADEVIDWSIAKLAHTGPSIAHAALDVALRTYPVDDADDDALSGDATTVTAFIRIVFGPQLRADRYELDFRHLGEWIIHDAIEFVDKPEADPGGPG